MTRPLSGRSGSALAVRAGRRLLNTLGSLRSAIILLSLFTVCLAGATAVESAVGARAAQELVYRAWWFVLLLVLLAINVLGAALKKYPWRRHQTGFLITHAGLLLLLLGGLLTAAFGVEGQMILIDTPNAELQARLGLSNQAQAIYLDGLHRLDVFRLRRPVAAQIGDVARLVRTVDGGLPVPDDLHGWVEREWSFLVNPGVFTWVSDDYATRRLPWTLDYLDRLATPAPGINRSLDGGVTLNVRNFYPHVEAAPDHPLGFVPREPRRGSEAARQPTPALRCSLTSGTQTQDFGVAMFLGAARVRLGNELYLVRLRPAVNPVPFTVTLKRAWQVQDPGSDRPGWFQSDVLLTSTTGARSCSVSMNRTADDGLYKIYQANYRRLTLPATGEPLEDGGRPVSLSGLAVAHDPGLWLKYLGSLTVVAGIATMFWMKAYFFKSSGRESRRKAGAGEEKPLLQPAEVLEV
jgi:hypothetical protein